MAEEDLDDFLNSLKDDEPIKKEEPVKSAPAPRVLITSKPVLGSAAREAAKIKIVSSVTSSTSSVYIPNSMLSVPAPTVKTRIKGTPVPAFDGVLL